MDTPPPPVSEAGCALLRVMDVGGDKVDTLAFGSDFVSSWFTQVWGVPFSLQSPFPAGLTVGVVAGHTADGTAATLCTGPPATECGVLVF